MSGESYCKRCVHNSGTKPGEDRCDHIGACTVILRDGVVCREEMAEKVGVRVHSAGFRFQSFDWPEKYDGVYITYCAGWAAEKPQPAAAAMYWAQQAEAYQARIDELEAALEPLIRPERVLGFTALDGGLALVLTLDIEQLAHAWCTWHEGREVRDGKDK